MSKLALLNWIILAVIICSLAFLPANGSPICSDDQFLCKTGECISASWKCDKEDDCGDNSDEEDCVTGCKFPSGLEHGTVIFENPEDAELKTPAPDDYILQFRCDAGYELAGPKIIICLKMEWTDRIPQCVQLHCRTPPQIGNGTSNVRKGVNRRAIIGSTVEYSCSKGFELANVNASSLTCKLNGTSAIWSGDMPSCKETDVCPDPGVSPDGSRTGNCCFKGDVLKFSCKKGYERVGSQETECLAGGTWSAPRARCRPPGILCPDLPNLANGIIESETASDFYAPGDEVIITCNEGYAIRDGSDQLFCEDEGAWDDVLGSCDVVPCKFPEFPLNGTVLQLKDTNATTFPYGFHLTYACDAGFRLIGNSWNTCKKGRWIFETPKCEVIRCYDPGTPEKGFREGNSFEVGSKVTYTCFSGHTLIGSVERYCLRNGQWSGELTKCNLGSNYCPDPGVPINGMKTGNSYNEADTVEYRCNPGFSLVGSATRVCQPNRLWTGEEPKCLGPYDSDNNAEISERLKLIVRDKTEEQQKESEKYRDALLKLTSNANFSSLEELEMAVTRSRILNLNYPGHLILYFIFDSSGSVGPEDFRISVEFAKALVRKVQVTPTGARVGALSFSSDAVVQFKPVQATTTEEVIQELDAMNYTSGGTATSVALEKLYADEIPLTSELLGPNTKSVVFILTDGKANMGGDPQVWAEKLKEAGVEIYCIGITGSMEKASLYKIASTPTHEHVFILSNYTTMSWLVQEITNGTIDYSECGLGLERVAARGRPKREAQTPRIIGGEKALEPWPWMAALFIADKANDGPQGAVLQCGGSIVGNRWILTAAHCVVDKKNNNRLRDLQSVIVKLGLTNLKNESSLLEFEPIEFIKHEQYDPETLDYDIALIKLDRLIEYSIYVRPICLPPEELDEGTTLYKHRETAFVTGWGHSKKKGPNEKIRQKTMEHLKELRLPIQSNDRCEKSLKGKPFIFTDRMFCAGSGLGEVDTCQGDSGGPMMQSQLNHEGNVYWVQVGVVSWGIGCGQLHTYGFYTHVQHLRNWVLETMNSN